MQSIHPKLHALFSLLLALPLAACDGGGVDPETDAGSRLDGGEVACAAGGETITGEIDADTRWSCPLYLLDGIVFVTEGATLTIGAGVEVLGETGGSEVAALIVTRGARLVTEGTASEPVVFSSGNPEGARATGDWAGVALLGTARTNDGNCVDGAGDACTGGYLEDRLEGIDVSDPRGIYGGADDASGCGSLRYTRIEFAGRELSPDNELNGLTIAGCGSATRLSYVQIHRGKDDGLELFGGAANFDHVIISGASDDSLDFDEGWRGNGQFVVLHQFPGLGDRGIEADNLGSDESAEPRTEPVLSNLTLIGESEHKAALFREGMLGQFRNVLVSGHGGPIDIAANTADPNPMWPSRLVVEYAALFGVAPFAAEDLDGDDVCAMAGSSWTGAGAWPASCSDLSDDQEDHYSGVASERLDDDFGLDEAALFDDAARSNLVSDAEPGFASTSATAPSYVPSMPALSAGVAPTFNANAPSDFGDASAAYIGAFEPGGEDWSAGWAAFPMN